MAEFELGSFARKKRRKKKSGAVSSPVAGAPSPNEAPPPAVSSIDPETVPTTAPLIDLVSEEAVAVQAASSTTAAPARRKTPKGNKTRQQGGGLGAFWQSVRQKDQSLRAERQARKAQLKEKARQLARQQSTTAGPTSSTRDRPVTQPVTQPVTRPDDSSNQTTGRAEEAGCSDLPQGRENCLHGLTFAVLDCADTARIEHYIKQLKGRIVKPESAKHVIGGDKGMSLAEFASFVRRQVGRLVPEMSALRRRALKQREKRLAEQDSERALLVDKYKPKQPGDLVGDVNIFRSIDAFVTGWRYGRGFRNKKALLLSGPPGIGKSSAVAVIAKHRGLRVIEFNASDSRNASSVRAKLGALSGKGRSSGGLLTMFQRQAKSKRSQEKKDQEKDESKDESAKTIVIMDEVDGMSSGDRGGMAALIEVLQRCETPFVCICNERDSSKLRSLASHCVDLRMLHPTFAQIANRLRGVCQAEGIEIDDAVLHKVYGTARGDVRQMLHALQMWRDGGVLEECSGKDTNDPVHEAPGILWNTRLPLERRLNSYFSDSRLVPLLVHDTANAALKSCTSLRDAARAADLLSASDLVEQQIARQQQYSLMPLHGVLSCVAPAHALSRHRPVTDRNMRRIPSFFTFHSRHKKATRECGEIRSALWASSIAASVDTVAQQLAPLLRHKLLGRLVTEGKPAVTPVVQECLRLHLSRSDLDTLQEFCRWPRESPLRVQGQVKAAVTREFTKQLQHIKETKRSKRGSKRRRN